MSRNDHTHSHEFSLPSRRKIFLVLLAVVLLQGGLLSPAALSSDSVADLDDRTTSRQKELDMMQEELTRLRDLMAAGDAALEESRMQMAEANARLRLAEDRYNEALAIYEDRLIALYKSGEHQYYNLIITSEGLNDALTRIMYVDKISDNDIKLIKQVKAEERELRAAQAAVEELKMTTADSVEGLAGEAALLESEISLLQAEQDRELAELVTARAIEEEAAAQRLAQEAALADPFGLSSGPSVIVQSDPPADLQPTGSVLHGVASWYGPGFHGNTTANGEKYNMYAFTAAHKTLPFNTWLKVTYNGRSIFVRINDRGPYVGERFLDLSKAGAQALGFSGVAYVTAEIYR